MSSVRFICGTQDIHKDLERRIADFHKMDDAILYPSGFDSNAGFFEACLTSEDAIISDELNHASIIDGVSVVLKAKGEIEAAENIAKAAEILGNKEGALHLRTLHSVNDLSSDQSNTTIWMIPLEILRAVEKIGNRMEKK